MRDLTRGNIYKTFFLFGFPLVIAGLFGQLHGTINTAIAGHFLGSDGLAAIGATAPLITFVSSIFWGYSGGYSVYIARLFGAGHYQKIKDSIISNLLILFGLSIAVASLFLLFNGPIFDLLQVKDSIRNEAFAYFAIYIAGIFPIVCNAIFSHLITAFGIGTFPLFASILSSLLTIGGNLICVAWLGLGVGSLAFSTLIAALAVDVAYILKFRKCFDEMGIPKGKPHVSFFYVKDALAYSLPNMAQQMTMYFAGFLISPLVNGIGTAATAGYTILNRIYDIIASVYQNSARALSNFAAQCLGKNELHKVRRGVRAGVLQGVLFITPFVLVCVLFPQEICSLFFDAKTSLLARAYATRFVKFFLPLIFFQVICNLFHALYRGVKALRFLYLTTCFAAVVRLAASALLIPFLGMNGFFAGWVISWIAEAILTLVIYLFGWWMPKEMKAEPESA